MCVGGGGYVYCFIGEPLINKGQRKLFPSSVHSNCVCPHSYYYCFIGGNHLLTRGSKSCFPVVSTFVECVYTLVVCAHTVVMCVVLSIAARQATGVVGVATTITGCLPVVGLTTRFNVCFNCKLLLNGIGVVG